MKVLMPLWYVDILDRGHVLPLTETISKCLPPRPDSLHIAYIEGEPKKDWEGYFSLHKVNVPYGFLRSKMLRFYLSRRRLYSQVKDVDFDVVFTLSELWAQEFSRYLSGKVGVPYVVWLRGDHRSVRRSMNVNPTVEGALNYLESRGLKKANLVMPNSRALARKAEEWGVEKDRITPPVYMGVDASMFRPMSVERSNKFTVAYAGRISPEKRVPQLLGIIKRMTGMHCIIAGRRQMSLSLPDYVEYLGELPFSEMPAFYNKADLIVLPSVTEGFPSVILEAYACGKPVIAAREAFPEELKIFGSVADISEFETEIRVLMNSDLEALGREARSYVKKHYSWDRFGRSIIRYLKSVTVN